MPFCGYLINLTLDVYRIFVGPFCKILLILEICEANSGPRSVATMQKRDDARWNALRYRTIEYLDIFSEQRSMLAYFLLGAA